MKKLLQINSVVNVGSTGRIAEAIGQTAIKNGWESYIAYGREANSSQSELISIGSHYDVFMHGLYTRLTDRHGFASKKATQKLIKKITAIQPDVVGLHNLHGYYLYFPGLFKFLKKNEIPIIWTFHDCWPFTGHCIHYVRANCDKWKTHCKKCPLSQSYPQSLWIDNSYNNYEDKRAIFCGHPNLTIVTPSEWLKNQVKQSFLADYPTRVIHNGIDLNKFCILNNRSLKKRGDKTKILLGVASLWNGQKGLADFLKLADVLPDNFHIVLVGLDNKQLQALPKNVTGISKTKSVNKLVKWYNKADIYLNLTYEDNFPTTNLEALACGTPVISYHTGGSPEAINPETGIAIPKGDLSALRTAINEILNKEKFTADKCRKRAVHLFDEKDRFNEYFMLYQKKAKEYNSPGV